MSANVQDTMPDADGAKDPKPVGFLDLSLEIRDQIYRELLFQPIRYGAARRRHKFETSILRVNKQMHQEASRVLYEENAWVMFDLPPGCVDAVSHKYLNMVSCEVPAGRIPFGGIPSLMIYVQDDRSRHLKHREYVFIPLEWVRDMTRLFIRNDIANGAWHLGDIRFTIHLRESRKHESRRRMAMEFLECLRGVGKAKIHGLSSPPTIISATRTTLHPIHPIDEVIDLASMYIRHAELMRAQGQFGHAEELYEQAYDCSCWATWPAMIANADPTKLKIFEDQLYKSLEGAAFCALKNGGPYRACKKLKEFIRGPSKMSHWQIATAFYYYGLACVGAGEDNRALWGFMRALVLVPGYEGIDREVDAIEARLSESRYPNSLLSWNLELVRPCRHQDAGNVTLTQKEKYKVVKGFCLTITS